MKEEDSGIPIIAVDAMGDMVNTDALEAGADRAIAKPFRVAEFLQVVKELLQDGSAE